MDFPHKNNKTNRIELLLPAGNIQCLRAAVANGADSVYLGLDRFNARISADNFNKNNIFSAIKFCHKRGVKAYITFNTLVKNNELTEFLEQISIAEQANADAIIIQDINLIPIIKKNFSKLKIHLSTQATITNSYSIPKNIERVILARELTIDEIRLISERAKQDNIQTEVFCHGALCFSYSGQCLFSSMVGGRSGNRGLCAQPCRKIYNNSYLLSTMDLCLVSKIPELVKAGVSCLKIEGRMRSALYVATAAKIYRRYIDLYYNNKFKTEKDIEQKDIDELMLAFNRGFTAGFGFENSVTDTKKQTNRGLYLGFFKNENPNKSEGSFGPKSSILGIKLKQNLKKGDGIAIWRKDKIVGYKIDFSAKKGDIIEIPMKGAKEGDYVYKTSSVDSKIELGDELIIEKHIITPKKIIFPKLKQLENTNNKTIAAKAYNKQSAIALDKAKADIIYYDITKDDCKDIKQIIKYSRFFVFTPRIISDKEIESIAKKIQQIKPEGVLVGNPGFLPFLKDYEIHLDYSFNCFNDIDINSYALNNFIPIISPELNFNEISQLKNKNIIILIHGDIVLMTTKEPLKAPELIDEEKRHFKVRQSNKVYEILNSKQLGLFNKSKEYLKAGIKYFYIDLQKNADKFVRIYRKILNNEFFDDKKIKKGYTTGQFSRTVI